MIVPAPSEFNQSRFDRIRRIRPLKDIEANFASPEDAIIKKMEFYQMGGSEKHLRDIASVLRTSRDQIDIPYIGRWATELGLDEIWTSIQQSLIR